MRTLKIDPSFVRDVDSSSSIIDAILALARALGLSVVAEGVETEDQRASLLARGCTEMQGFHFSPPVEAEKFMVLLRAGTHLATPAD